MPDFSYYRRPIGVRIQYPHLTFSAFAKTFRDFIHYEIYNKFNGIIFAPYNKAIQFYFQEYINKGGPIDFGLPIFNYDFIIESPEDKIDAPWRSTNWSIGTARRIYEPFYSDEDMDLIIGYRRLKGTINMNIFCSSQPELVDIQTSFYDGFFGINKYRIGRIRSYAVIPERFLFTNYAGVQVMKDINKQNIRRNFIPAINLNKYYVHSNTSVLMNLQSISPSSNYYGSNGMPEYNLTGSVNFELEIPQYIMALTKEFKDMQIDVDMDFGYSSKDIEDRLNEYLGSRVKYSELESNEKIIEFEKGYVVDRFAIYMNEDSDSIPFDEKLNKYKTMILDKDIVKIYVAPGMILFSDDEDNDMEITEDDIKFHFQIHKGDLLQIIFLRKKDANIEPA